MTSRSEKDSETPTAPNVQVLHAGVIRYCEDHLDEIKQALNERQLDYSIIEEEILRKAEAGEPDACMELIASLTNFALHTLGPVYLFGSGGCPVCAIKNIVYHMADAIAADVKEAN